MVWVLMINSDSELWEMLMCGQNQDQNSLTLFRGNSHCVTLEKLLLTALAQNKCQSDRRHCQARCPYPADYTHSNRSGGKIRGKKLIGKEFLF